MRATGSAALGAARRLELEAGEVHEIEQQQFAVELPGNSEQDFNRQQRLQCAKGARDRPQHSGFSTIADYAVGSGIRPQAAQTGVLRLRLVHLKLSFVLVDA